jgi:hypothetical protein
VIDWLHTQITDKTPPDEHQLAFFKQATGLDKESHPYYLAKENPSDNWRHGEAMEEEDDPFADQFDE